MPIRKGNCNDGRPIGRPIVDVATAKREKDNDNSLIVAQVLVMLTQNYSHFIGEVKGNLKQK